MAVRRRRPDMVVHGLRHGAEQGLAGAQLFLGALLRRDVAHRADEADGGAACEVSPAGRGDPALDAVGQADRAVLHLEG